MGDRFAKVNLVLSFSVKIRNRFPIFAGVPPTTCSERSVDLVRYPTTLAPASGSVPVTTQCADNAHVRSGSSLSVRCTSSGSWSGTPVCECDAGYQAATVSERQICQSKHCIIYTVLSLTSLFLSLNIHSNHFYSTSSRLVS